VSNVVVANVVINVENVLDYNGLHPIFTYIPSKVQMFFTLWKPYVMFLFNSLAMLLQLCLLWQCHFSSIYSLNRLSYGNVICGTIVVCLTTCTTIGTPLTTIGTANGSTLPFIIFYAFKYMLSCSLFIPETKAPPSSTLFFLLRALFEEFDATFFMFSSVVYISSLVLLTLANFFVDCPFDAQTNFERFLPIIR
jgi:hypothetical protein